MTEMALLSIYHIYRIYTKKGRKGHLYWKHRPCPAQHHGMAFGFHGFFSHAPHSIMLIMRSWHGLWVLQVFQGFQESQTCLESRHPGTNRWWEKKVLVISWHSWGVETLKPFNRFNAFNGTAVTARIQICFAQEWLVHASLSMVWVPQFKPFKCSQMLLAIWVICAICAICSIWL